MCFKIQYIFSDKTGTLTRNSLDFRKCIVGTKSYGHGETEISRAAARKRAADEVIKAKQDGIPDADMTDFIPEEREFNNHLLIICFTEFILKLNTLYYCLLQCFAEILAS